MHPSFSKFACLLALLLAILVALARTGIMPLKTIGVLIRLEIWLWLEMWGWGCAGDWAEGEARDLAGPDEEDNDEAHGEVIDMETGTQPASCQCFCCVHA